jgi:hypothetical protein
MKFKYLKQLENDLEHMERHQKLFIVLRTHFIKMGYWSIKPRGDASKGYQTMKQTLNKTDSTNSGEYSDS